MKLDPFFSCLLLLTVGWSVCHYISIKDRVQQRQQEKSFYPRTSSVLLWTGLVAGISLLVQGAGRRLLRPVAARMLPRDRWGAQVYGLKQSRFAEMSMKAVYFLLLTGTAYYFLHEESWWPTLLGGSGGEAALFTEHPYQQSHWFTHWYFYISAGYHLSCFLSLTLAPKLPDFFETLLVCVCGLLLIFFSYLGNFLRVGSIILFCHDFCDIFSCGCKVFVDTRHKLVTFCLFACLVTSWAYLRLYTFPVATLFPIFKNVKDKRLTAESEGWGFFVFLLLTVFVMDIYWFGLMLKMCMHFCTSGQMSDLHTPVPGASEEQELEATKQKDSSSLGRTSGGSKTNQRSGMNNSSSIRGGESSCVASSQGASQWSVGSQQTTARLGSSSSSKEQKAGTVTGAGSCRRENNSNASGSDNTTGSSTRGSSTNKNRNRAAGAAAAPDAAAAIQSETTGATSQSEQYQGFANGGGQRENKECKKAFCYATAEAENAEGELLTCSGSSTSSGNNIVVTNTGAARKLLAKARA